MGCNIHGHRGARGLRPESTLPAFEVALDLMVDTLELDLHLTADDQVIIWHDEALWAEKGAFTTGTPIELPAPMRSLSVEQIKGFRADQNPDPGRFDQQTTAPTQLAGDNFGLITLPELFAFVDVYASSEQKSKEQRSNARNVHFNIETKRVVAHPEYIGDDFDGESVGTFERVLLEAIDSADLVDRCIVQSFDFRSLHAISRIADDIRLSALSEYVPTVEEMVAVGASIWSPYYPLVTAENLDAAHQRGLEVLPWTVNTKPEMEALVELGVDGFITDRPDIGVQFG